MWFISRHFLLTESCEIGSFLVDLMLVVMVIDGEICS